MPEPKKVMCLDCDKEVVLKNGICPECGLNNQAVLERDRHMRALAKLRKQRNEESDEESSNPFDNF